MYFPLVVFSFIRSKGYKRKSFSYVVDHYLIVYGLYIIARLWFERVKPKALILSNALNAYHRVLAKAARDERLLTVYLQHASVPENSPPLDFDYALLEGHDALHTYIRFGLAQTRVYLIGMPKYDPYCGDVNQRATISSVGVCTSTLNSVDRAEQLCSSIRQEFTALPVILRVHNADPRVREWKDLAQRYALEFSDSQTVISFDFLKGVDLIIAGDSNILLEAALMNVVPLYYGFDQGELDYYRFHRNGLVEYFSEPHEVCRALREMFRDRPSVRMKAKEYCDTVGTRYDGHSSEIAGALIQELASNNLAPEGWKRIPNIIAEAYELTYSQNSV